jgi:YHS domain-containing protein
MNTPLSLVRAINVGRRTFIRSVFAAVLSVTMGVSAAHAGELVNAQADGVAVDGFDVVAYHTAGAPAKGSASHSVEYKGKTWLFSSAANASAFAANPAKHEPQHNGWCSYAVSEGYGAEVDFVNGWAVLDGKLYLNWDEETRDAFVDEQSKRIPQAKENWPSVHAGLQDGSVDMYTHAGEGVDIAHPQQLN